MAALVSALMTVDDWFNLPDDSPSSEIIDGELLMAPPPDLFHQDIALNIAALLKSYLRGNPIGKVYIAPTGLVLDGGTGLQPDILFVSNAKKSLISQRAVEGGPDLVVEVLSPSTSKQDRGVKKDKYTTHGVTEYWIVDPKKRTIEIYYLQKDSARPAYVYSADNSFTSELFPGLTFAGREIFAS